MLWMLGVGSSHRDGSFDHKTSVLGDDSFAHPGQIIKWMDLRVSPILYTLFDQCDI